MPSMFRSWTYKHATEALAALTARAGGEDAFTINRAYAELGDHWQNGEGWSASGSIPVAIRQRMLAACEPQFRPVDVIGEVLDNVANGLLDKEPDVSFTPIAPAEPDSAEGKRQAAEIDRMISLISTWWDRRHFWEKARAATRRSRWATYGSMRAWITRATLIESKKEDGTTSYSLPTNLPFDQALDAVKLAAPDPKTGFVYTDADTEAQCGIFFFETGTGDSAEKYVEIWFVEEGKAVLRVLASEADAAAAQEYSLPINRLPMAQMDASLLITDPVRRQQKTLNFFETGLVRVVETAGFPERYTTNAAPQGVWDRTPPVDAPPLDVRDVDGVKWYLHAVPRMLGPMITNDLRGIVTEDDTGKKSTATPGIIKFEPTDPEYITKVSNHGRQTILRSCKQGHLATDSTAEASGNAYVQARAIFGKDLRAVKAPLDGMVRDILEAAIALAESMSTTAPAVEGAPAREAGSFLSRYRCVVNLHVDTGPPVPAEMQEYRAQNAAGLLARESAMARCGVEDVAAEIAALDQDPIVRANLWKVRGEAMDAIQKGGGSFAGSAEAIGITPNELTMLAKKDTERNDINP